VFVASGVYDETVSTLRNGTATDPITINGQSIATIRQVYLSHAHIRLLNTTLTGVTQQYSRLLYLRPGTHHCVISNNVIDAADALRVYGIDFSVGSVKPFDTNAPSHNLLIANTVKRVLAITMVNVAGDHNVIRGNRIIDGGQVDFFRLFGRSNHIVGNVCSNNYVVSGLGNHPDFIQTFGNNGYASRGHVIERNLVINIEGGQLTQLEGNLLPDTRDWTFINNLFVDVALQASCTIPEVKYYNNTFIRCNKVNGGHALTFGARYYDGRSVDDGSSGTNYAHGARVINNVFLDCGDTTSNKGWYGFNTVLTNIVADYNFVSKNSFSSVKLDSQQREVGSSGGWSSFDWWEPNGINGGDPRFVSYWLGNYALLPDSPLIDRGQILPGIVADYIGNSRPQGTRFDIGAYEFISGVIPIAPSKVQGIQIVR
jgi:hypothetical protein